MSRECTQKSRTFDLFVFIREFRGQFFYQRLSAQICGKGFVQQKTLPYGRALILGPIAGYTLKDEPQPQVLFTLGFSNLKPEASSVSTKSTVQPSRYMAEVAST